MKQARGTERTSDREQAIFEAGIKLGALYHQWVGTPDLAGVGSKRGSGHRESRDPPAFCRGDNGEARPFCNEKECIRVQRTLRSDV